MTKVLRKTSILLVTGLFLMASACTTIKPAYNIDDESYASKVNVGDRIRLTYLDGQGKEIEVTEVSETEIRGTICKNTPFQPKGALVIADWQDIRAVETVKISAIKTAGALLPRILRVEPGFGDRNFGDRAVLCDLLANDVCIAKNDKHEVIGRRVNRVDDLGD